MSTPSTTALALLLFVRDVFWRAIRSGSHSVFERCHPRAALLSDLADALESGGEVTRRVRACALAHGWELLGAHALDVGAQERGEQLLQDLAIGQLVVDVDGLKPTAQEAVPLWRAFVEWHREQEQILAGRVPVAGGRTVELLGARRRKLEQELALLEDWKETR